MKMITIILLLLMFILVIGLSNSTYNPNYKISLPQKFNNIDMEIVINQFNFTEPLSLIQVKNEYYLYFTYKIPTNNVANKLKGSEINMTYVIDFKRDINNDLNKRLIKINEKYRYNPTYFCGFKNGNETEWISGELVRKRKLSDTSIGFDVRYFFEDTDVDEFGNDIVKDLNIKKDTVIVCIDAIQEIQSALNFNGIVTWGQFAAANTTQKNWTGGTGFEVGERDDNNQPDGAGFMLSDYSRIKDIGIIAHSDRTSDMDVHVFNTSTGATISFTKVEDNIGSNNEPRGNVMFYNFSSTAIIVYEESSTANDQFAYRIHNNTGLEAEQILTFDTPAAGSGNVRWMNIKQRPGGSNETAISWHNTGGTDSVGFIIYDIDTNTKLFNWSSGAELTPTQTSGNNQDIAWNSDGELLFITTYNRTSLGEGDLAWYVYNTTSDTVSSVYLDPTSLVDDDLDDIRTCRMRGRNDGVISIMQDDGSDCCVAVILSNGSIESGNPTCDATCEKDTGEVNINIGCYMEEATDEVILMMVDGGALGIETFRYNVSEKNWSISAVGTGDASGNFAGDDIETVQYVPCPEGDCFMVSTIDALDNIFSGVFWNGSVIDISQATNLSGSVGDDGRQPFAFMFEGNLSVVAAPPPSQTQTPTPTPDLLNISQNNESIELNASDVCAEKCLIYQDGVNVVNISSFPFNRTGLTNNTEYSFNFTVFNDTFDIEESNFSNTITTTTLQNVEGPPPTQTPTPTPDLLNISFNNESVQLNASSSCQVRCLLYQDGVNVINFSSFPFNRTGLSNQTSFSFNFTVFNDTFSIPESNFSNTITTTTGQNVEGPPAPPVAETSEPEESVALLIIGVMFWLVHVGFKIETRNDEDELLPIQSMIAMILFATAGFMAYFSIQAMLGMALANSFDAQILAALNGIHTFTTWAGFIVFVLALLGLLIFIIQFIFGIIEERVLQ